MTWSRAAVLLAALGVAGCGGSTDPLSLPVDERGPFQTGYRSWEVTYQPTVDEAPRTILLHLWYPTEDTDGYSAVYQGLFRDDDAFEDATPAAPIHDDGYPVLVHSHGFRGYGGNSADIMGYYASHGWLAIAPDHTNNTLFEDDPLPTAHYYHRAMDVTRAIDELTAVELPGQAVTERVMMSGHSFGTFTTWASAGALFDETIVRQKCEAGDVPSGICTEAEIQTLLAGGRDERVVAVMPMAGGSRDWFGDAGMDVVDIPVFLMTGSDDDVGAQALFDGVSNVDLRWMDVEGGCHQLFGMGGCDGIEDAEGFQIVNTYALAFGRAMLLGDQSATVAGILDGTVDVSPKVALVSKKNRP